jgi:uroporphyrinogen decarboxylase
MGARTGRELVQGCFEGEPVERVPAFPVLGALAAKLRGLNVRKYVTDAGELARSQLNAYSLLGQDIVTVICDTLLEAEALGNVLQFPDEAVPRVEKYALGEPRKLGSLELPDPQRDGRMPMVLEACQRVAQEVKDAAVWSTARGPWTIAANLRGAEQLIYDVFDRPDFVHDLLRFTTEVNKVYGSALIQTGVGLMISEPAASISLISPEIYTRFIKPPHAQVVEHFRGLGQHLTIHVCGYIDPVMEDIVDTGMGGVSFDKQSSIEKMVEASRGKTVVVGNVDTILFESGAREEMEAGVRQCVDAAAGRSPFILCSGCEVPPTSPWENVEHFMDAARRYGRLN